MDERLDLRPLASGQEPCRSSLSRIIATRFLAGLRSTRLYLVGALRQRHRCPCAERSLATASPAADRAGTASCGSARLPSLCTGMCNRSSDLIRGQPKRRRARGRLRGKVTTCLIRQRLVGRDISIAQRLSDRRTCDHSSPNIKTGLQVRVRSQRFLPPKGGKAHDMR